MTEASNLRFNAEAASWDSNPDVQNASSSALVAILERFPQLKTDQRNGATNGTKGYNVLELGCGTGILSFKIAPYVNHVVAVDASEGMISALKQKLAVTDANPPQNITPLNILLVDPEDSRLPPAPSGTGRLKYDLILSHLVLHHIPDLRETLTTMFGCLVSSTGWIALTDYEDYGPEARRFHPEAKMEGVERHGIDRAWFEGLMKEVGFVDVKAEVGWIMSKNIERFPGEWGNTMPDGSDGETRPQGKFPFLVCMGRKP